MEAFDRRQIAEILGMPYALVKNWSVGRPLKIEPSIHAPAQRGKQSLYSREDVYRFGLARLLSSRGLSFDAVNSILSSFDPKWFKPEIRGLLTAFNLHHDDAPRLIHSKRALGRLGALEHVHKSMEKYGGSDKVNVWHSLDLAHILDWVDERINAIQHNPSRK